MSIYFQAEALSMYLTEAVEKKAYDCECQVGGVDAMSLDTDWLREVAASFVKTVNAIQRVRDLHKPCDNCDYHVFDHCVSCCRLWPCPTIKALDGEQG